MRFVAVVLIILTCWTVPGYANSGRVDSTWYLQQRTNTIDTRVNLNLFPGLTLKLGGQVVGQMEELEEFESGVTLMALEYLVTPNLAVFGGYNNPKISQARMNPVFLSGKQSFPMIGYELMGEKFTYQKMYGDLRDSEDFKRVGIHYFSWDLHPSLRLGIGEAFITEEPFPGDFIYNTVPFIPYYLAKYLPGVSSRPNNALVYGDGELQLATATLYGELMLNEWPLEPGAGNPKLYAITLGIKGPVSDDWNGLAEFSKVTNYAYANGRLDTTYSLGDKPLGHPLGDDLASFNLQFMRSFPRLDAKIGLFYRTWADSELVEWEPDGTLRDEKIFLAGVPEQLFGTQLGAGYRLNEEVTIGLDLEVGRAKHYQHVRDEIGYRYQAVAKISWQLP